MKNKTIGVIIVIFLIVGGLFAYHVYQIYAPLSEIKDYGNIGFVPYIEVIEADMERLIMDIPIIIWNPSTKDAKIPEVDFWVYMEGKPLTSGTLLSYELPAQQYTTIWLTDVIIKYEELRDVIHVVAARHGAEMVMEGKANIAMTVDLVIYFPIEIFGISIHTFTFPIDGIKTELPINMLKQNEEVKRQIGEIIKEVLASIPFVPPVAPPPVLSTSTIHQYYPPVP